MIIIAYNGMNSQELSLDKNRVIFEIDSIKSNYNKEKRFAELLKLMNSYRESGEYISTIIVIKGLIKTYNLDERKRTFAGLNTYLGQAYNGLGLFSETINNVTKSYIYAKKNKDTAILISSLMILSEAYAKLNFKKKSEDLMLEAYKVSNTIDDKYYKKLVLNNYTSVLLDLKKLDSAMFYLNKLESLEIKDSITSQVHLNKCSCFLMQNKLDTALVYCNLFEKELVFFKNAHNRMTLQELFSNIYLKKGNHKKSINYAKNALDIALKYKYKKDAVDIYNLFSDIYKENDHLLSDKFKQKAKILMDSLEMVNMHKALDNIKLIHNIEKKSLEINNLKLENNLKKYKIKTLLFLLVASIIILLIIISQKAKINKAYRLIVNDNIKSLKDHEEIIKLRHKTAITDDVSEEIEMRIRQLFDIDKIFLQKDLDLDKLANMVNTNRGYLSYVFNNVINMSFNEMLNDYRVNESKKLLLKNNKKYTIETTALDSGFKNKATFNRNFKKITGVTPSFFIKNAQGKI